MEETAVDFLYDVWAVQPPGFAFVSIRRGPTEWQDKAVQVPDEHEQLWVPDPSEGDIYFTPNTFNRPLRRGGLVLESRWLYADLDQVDPRELDEKLKPTVAWESSPGRFQAMWFVQLLERETHQILNRKLTYLLGADRGGWDSSQVLRVPGTQNHKYEGNPQVKLLWWRNRQFRVKGTPYKGRAVVGGSRLKVVTLDGKAMPPWVRSKLRQKRANGDRSRVLYKMEVTLLQAGFSKDEVFTLLRPSVWNKFDDDGLSADIHRAAERAR